MKRIIPLLLILTGAISFGFCQNPVLQLKNETAGITVPKTTDTVKKAWNTGGLISINISQGSQSNWAAGGDNFSFAATGLFNGFANFSKGKSFWDNAANVAYGYLNTTTLGARKNQDQYDLTTKYGYSAGHHWYYTFMADFRSQFSNGYLYTANQPPQFNSAFLSPAYLLLSLGMEYKPNDSFSVFISPLTSRWTFVMNDSLSFYGKYGVNSGAHSLNQIGAFLSINYIVPLSRVLSYTTRLDLFSNYEKDPLALDVYFTNLVAIKLGKYLAATLIVNLIYDNNILFPDGQGRMIPRLQFQELTGVGFSYKF
ncbi:MAG TPA: DUF3078 domain-containing protein [Chitinophagaceae bacterium]|nr:DUF3078 domain-containing protein [Chitinophagaceae bacterium]